MTVLDFSVYGFITVINIQLFCLMYKKPTIVKTLANVPQTNINNLLHWNICQGH